MTEERMQEIAEKLGYDGLIRYGSEIAKAYTKKDEEMFLRFVEGAVYAYHYYGEVGQYKEE